MIVSIHQPAYLPWLGYFHKIALSDVFIFFETTQFEKNSFINRNKIKTSNGPVWLTVPVKLENHLEKKINEIALANKVWQGAHWKTIEYNYKKSKYWGIYSNQLRELYQKEYFNIADLCYDQLLLITNWLQIKTKIIRSIDLRNYESKKQQVVLDICLDLKADLYISGKLGKNYLEEKKFEEQGIKVFFQDYQPPHYQQLWGGFVPYLGIIDLLFNEGHQSLEIIFKGNIPKNNLISNNVYEK